MRRLRAGPGRPATPADGVTPKTVLELLGQFGQFENGHGLDRFYDLVSA